MADHARNGTIMKKVALTALVLALGLAACESKTANAVDNTDVENAVEADAAAADNSVDNALDAAGNAVENTGDAVSNVGTATDNAVANEVNEAN
jgi:hypothetical protein